MGTNFESNLGEFARDKVTGFEGIITAYAKHLYGCDSYFLTPRVTKDMKREDSGWFDVGRIAIIKGKGINPKTVKAEKNGGEELLGIN